MAVETTSLDQFCADRGLTPDVLKIDVEGAELEVLRGARQILASPTVSAFVEFHPSIWADAVSRPLTGAGASGDGPRCAAIGSRFRRLDHGGCLRQARQTLMRILIANDSRVDGGGVGTYLASLIGCSKPTATPSRWCMMARTLSDGREPLPGRRAWSS